MKQKLSEQINKIKAKQQPFNKALKDNTHSLIFAVFVLSIISICVSIHQYTALRDQIYYTYRENMTRNYKNTEELKQELFELNQKIKALESSVDSIQ